MKLVFTFALIIIFTFSAGLSFAQTTTKAQDIAQLKNQYDDLVSQLAVLLQQKIQELTLQIEQIRASRAGSVAVSTSSAPATSSASNKQFIEPYLPSWHLAPGSCFPVYY